LHQSTRAFKRAQQKSNALECTEAPTMNARTRDQSIQTACLTEVPERRTIRRTPVWAQVVMLICIGSGFPQVGIAQREPEGHATLLPVRLAPSWYLLQDSVNRRPPDYQTRFCAEHVSYCAMQRSALVMRIEIEPLREKPTIESGLGLGFWIGAVAAPLTGLVAGAGPAAMVVVGGGAGLVAGGTVAAIGQNNSMNFGRGFSIGLLPGAAAGALVGATFSHPVAPLLWGSILAIPSALAGGIVGALFTGLEP
jgi:hypothetical protein